MRRRQPRFPPTSRSSSTRIFVWHDYQGTAGGISDRYPANYCYRCRTRRGKRRFFRQYVPPRSILRSFVLISVERYIKKVIGRTNYDIGAKMANFLATGNLVSPTGLDLQQASGFTIVAEKLNWMRYISHFRSIHRGAFFAELKTTTVRKLLPEAWGFLCPVHTPDGSPCGLLNHLSRTCRIITRPLSVAHIPALLVAHGMTQAFSPSVDGRRNLCVQLDGRVIGWAPQQTLKQLATNLRIWKTENKHNVPLDLEIGFVPTSHGGQYPGLYLFSTRARLMRPVKYLANGRDDQIGSFEQVYMDIACTPEEIEDGVSTHVEHSPTNFLSILANLTPFSDFNQSPRNIYQCQVRSNSPCS